MGDNCSERLASTNLLFVTSQKAKLLWPIAICLDNIVYIILEYWDKEQRLERRLA
jgi:hypothetical protein